MKIYFYSIPLLVGTAVFLTCVLGQLVLRQGPEGWRRVLAWLALFGVFLGVSYAGNSIDSIKKFRANLRKLDQLGRAEECVSAKLVDRKNLGMVGFQSWASEVRRLQGTSDDSISKPVFSKVAEEDCELRRPHEPWLHYRWRRLTRPRASREGELAFFSSAWWATLSLRLKFKWIDWEENLQRGLRRGQEFNYLWLSDVELSSEMKKLLKGKMKVLRGSDPSFCMKIPSHPESIPEIRNLMQFLRIRAGSCDKKKAVVAATDSVIAASVQDLPECRWDAIRRRIHLGCISADSSDNGEVRIRSEELKIRSDVEMVGNGDVIIHTLRVPRAFAFYSEERGRSPNELRLTYEILRILDERFFFQASDQDPVDDQERELKIRLALGQGMPLTRLGVLGLFSPVLDSEIPTEVEAQLQWLDYSSQTKNLFQQFQRRAR